MLTEELADARAGPVLLERVAVEAGVEACADGEERGDAERECGDCRRRFDRLDDARAERLDGRRLGRWRLWFLRW
jgi:hypothetical protein